MSTIHKQLYALLEEQNCFIYNQEDVLSFNETTAEYVYSFLLFIYAFFKPIFEESPENSKVTTTEITNVEAPKLELDSKNVQVETKKENPSSKRFFAVQEFLTTERDYLQQLKYLSSFYESIQSGDCSKETKISKERLDRILPPGLNLIIKVSEELIDELSKVIDENDKEKTANAPLAQIFLDRISDLEVYFYYIYHCYSCIEEYNKLVEKHRSTFKKWIEKKSQDEAAQGKSLNSFLIIPIQRLPRYQSLLSTLLERTLLEHSDYKGLQDAVESVKRVTSGINQKMKNISGVLGGQETTRKFYLPLNSKRILIKKENIKEKNGTESFAYLLNDYLILQSESFFKTKTRILKLSDYQVKINTGKREIKLESSRDEWTFVGKNWMLSFEELQ